MKIFKKLFRYAQVWSLSFQQVLNRYQMIYFHQDMNTKTYFWGKIPKYGNLGPDPRKMKIFEKLVMWNTWESDFQRAINQCQITIFYQDLRQNKFVGPNSQNGNLGPDPAKRNIFKKIYDLGPDTPKMNIFKKLFFPVKCLIITLPTSPRPLSDVEFRLRYLTKRVLTPNPPKTGN